MIDWKDKLREADFGQDEYEDNYEENFRSLIDSAMKQDSGITEDKIFLTDFSIDDVNDFINILKSNPTENHRYDLEKVLENEILNWCKEHPERCPYEPFLWAIKISDGYVGSIQYNAVPQLWKIEAVCKAMLSVWDNKYISIIKNIITTWDWYQPVHIALLLYGERTDVNDEDTDNFIRTHWLRRTMYYQVAFDALCKKKKTLENIQALMFFVSQDTHTDLNNALITITKKMRNNMKYYILNSSEDEYAMELTYYKDRQSQFSKKAKLWCAEVFNEGLNDNDIIQFIRKWTPSELSDYNKESELERNLYRFFEMDNTKVITLAGKSGNSLFISAVLNLIEQKDFGFATQFYFKNIMLTAAVCPEYSEFIEKKYSLADNQYLNDEDFIYGCAYCYVHNPEILYRLISVYYLNGTGNNNAKYLFSALRIKYSEQFIAAIKKITDQCLNSLTLSMTLISNCGNIYDHKSYHLYPIDFDKICKKLLEEICLEGSSAPRCASILMDLYEHIVTYTNRARYYDDLQKILETKSHLLKDARTRANKKIIQIYNPT